VVAVAGNARTRLIAAAREQLLDPRGLVAFTIDAIARRAGVSRQTVYNQFGTKAGLLDAVCDQGATAFDLAARLPDAFSQPDPVEALTRFIATFGAFWSVDPDLTRRTLGLAELEPEYADVLRARDARRLTGLGVLIDRFDASPGFACSAARRQLLRILVTLTSFASYDSIAGDGRSPHQATASVTRLALAAIADAGLRLSPSSRRPARA
jgi:AcrR family transcriptional regulator